MAKVNAVRMTKPDPEFVSAVDHGAAETQGARFKIIKSLLRRPTPGGEDASGGVERERTVRVLREKRGILDAFIAALTGRGDAAVPSAATDAEHAVAELVFDRKQFEPAQAAAWAEARSLWADEVEQDDESLVLRQFEVADDDDAEAVEVADGVHAILVRAEKRQHGNVVYADPKNGKYPVDTKASIRAAWSHIDAVKNQSGYSAGELKSIKGRIVARWKKEIDAKGPPSAKKVAPTVVTTLTEKQDAAVDFASALADFEARECVGDLYRLIDIAQSVFSNIVWADADAVPNKAIALTAAVAAFSEELQECVGGMNEDAVSTSAAKAAALAYKRARRITVIDDADLRTAERVLSQILHQEDSMPLTPEETTKLKGDTKVVAALIRKAFPKGGDGADGSAILNRTVSIQDLLNAFEGGSVTDLINRLAAMETTKGDKPADAAAAEAAKKAADAAEAEKAEKARKAAEAEATKTLVKEALTEALKPVEDRMKVLETASRPGRGDTDAGRGGDPASKKVSKWGGVVRVGGRRDEDEAAA